MAKGSKVTMPDPDRKQVQQERSRSKARADHLCAEVMGRGPAAPRAGLSWPWGATMCPEDGASSVPGLQGILKYLLSEGINESSS